MRVNPPCRNPVLNTFNIVIKALTPENLTRRRQIPEWEKSHANNEITKSHRREKDSRSRGPSENVGDAAALKVDANQSGFPIVGIGASAGGLATFEAFFSGMPADTDTGMAFVLVQHLAPALGRAAFPP